MNKLLISAVLATATFSASAFAHDWDDGDRREHRPDLERKSRTSRRRPVRVGGQSRWSKPLQPGRPSGIAVQDR